MRVLLAEDSMTSLTILRTAVESLGHECVTARDGNEAWERWRDSAVETVISDWLMPGLDGDELCRRIRARRASVQVRGSRAKRDCIFLFSLARPWLVVAAIVAAFAVNLAVGIPLSREWAYWWSAAGVAVGGFVFALATGVAAWRTLRRADLYLYAAY